MKSLWRTEIGVQVTLWWVDGSSTASQGVQYILWLITVDSCLFLLLSIVMGTTLTLYQAYWL